MGLQLYSQSGNAIHLGTRLGSPGGEGVVYEVQSRASYAAKIYHQHILRDDPQKSAKLVAMTAIKTDRLMKLAAWPVETIHDKPGGRVTGFIMPRALGFKDVHKLYGVKTRKSEYPEARWPFLIHAASNVARAFQVVHEHGHVIGDVNHGGVLISNKATVMLVDCDSFQVTVNGNKFLCGVGIPTHTPPELQARSLNGVLRTANHDAFGLAVIIFQLLFLGRHPFSGTYLGRGDMPIEQAIKEFRFSYGPDASSRMMGQPPGSLPFDAISESLRVLFRRAFLPSSSSRPAAIEWIEPLSDLGKNLKQCQQNSGHHFIKTSSSCPWCEIELRSGTSVFYPVFVATNTGLGGFNIVAVWAQIEAVPAPTALPPPPTNSVVVGPSVQAKRIWRLRIIRDFCVTGGLIAVCVWLILSSVSATAAFWSVFAATVLTVVLLRVEVSKQTFALRTAKYDAEQKLNEIILKWRSADQLRDFQKQKEELQKKKVEYENLPRVLQSRIAHLTTHVKERQLERFLDGYRIDKASISGIGHARKITLRSFGIETAADISMHSILAIPGFGPVYASTMLAWRQTIERRFRFDPNRGVDPADKQAIHRDVAAARTKLQQEVQSGLARLRQISQRHSSSNTLLRRHADAAVRALSQAEADFTVGVGSARRFVPAVLIALLAMMAIGTFKRRPQIPPPLDRGSSVPVTPMPQSSVNAARPVMNPLAKAHDNYQTGLKLTKARRFAEAATAYRQAITLNPEYQAAYHELGYALYRLRNYDEALIATKRAISLDNSNAGSYRNLGLIFEGLSRWTEAEDAYNQALRVDPNNPATYFAIGRCSKNGGRRVEAIVAFKHAIKLKPDFAAARYELALAYAALGQTEAAWQEFDELVNLDRSLARKLYDELNNE